MPFDLTTLVALSVFCCIAYSLVKDLSYLPMLMGMLFTDDPIKAGFYSLIIILILGKAVDLAYAGIERDK